MNRIFIKSFLFATRVAVLACLAAALARGSHAQTIPNPSFESNNFTVAPGYISDNAEITGWTTDNPAGAGLSPTAGDTTFADNGAIPNGQKVAFITGGTTLSTIITGLTAGQVYKVILQANATTNQSPVFRANVDGTDIIALNVYVAGSTNPYAYVAFEFTATGATAALNLANDASAEHTLLIDNLSIAPSTRRITVDAWTDDATSGVDNQYVYTHAYNFGTTSDALINGIPFDGIGGANPAVANKFAAARFPNIFNNDANNITGGSAILARDFLYSGANIVSGTFQTITLTGLTPNTEYVATLYSVGWEGPSTSARWATFSVGNERLTINQDQFDNNNGIRISFRYTADAGGAATLRIAPMNPVNVSIHVYGFSNREAASRNVAPGINVQPASITVAQGLPVNLVVNASGFPAPTFQWRFNGSNIAGATSATNTIASATAQNAGTYDVIVSNSLGSVTSVVARLTVGLPMANPSFEVDEFVFWPGYSGENPGNATTGPGPNIPITGWTQSAPENSGLNPVQSGEAPFADNGTIPHGRQVAFIQTLGASTNTLSQTVTGLTAGQQYYLHYYENARSGPNPALEVLLGNNVAVPLHLVPSGSYREMFSDVFTAAGTSIDVTFSKSSPGGADSTVLIDNVAIVPVAAGTAPFIVRNPAATAAPVGDSVCFSAQAIGSLPLSFQWLRNGTPISGATNASLTLTNVQLDQAGDISLRVTNAGGSVTSSVARLTVTQPVPGLFNTGVDDNRVVLADGEVDPHYQLITNPHVPDSTDAIVHDSTVFPIVAGPWLANTASSKWIGPELNTQSGAVGIYTYRTTINLTGRDPRSVVILGRWATDNPGNDILVNGVSTGTTPSPGFNAYTPFAIYGTNTTFTAGTNTIDFIVENVQAIGYTGLRVEIDQSDARPAGTGGNRPTLQLARTGNSLSISWSPAAAGQRLQSTTNILGSWSDIQNASNPYTTTTTGDRMFFRVVQQQ